MPASYPGSVKTFTTRSAGQTIEAAHVNDLQDEVNAIEAGLRNGTAPLNSSNSTVVALSVTGGSTVGGNLGVAGNSSIGGNLAVGLNLGVAGASSLAALQVGNSTFSQGLHLSGAVQPATISTGDVNDYNPSGFDAVFFVRLVPSTAGSTLTGLVPTGTGRLVLLFNAGTVALGLKNANVGSASSNRFTFRSASDTSIGAGGSMLIYHDPAANVWVQAS